MKIALIALVGAASAASITQKTDKILENADSWDGWRPHMHEFPGTVNQNGNFMDAYERKIPSHFQGDAADQDYYPVDRFTRNILDNYAIEGVSGKKQKNPKPTGSFYLTKNGARRAAVEVLCTHFKKCDKDADAYLDYYYDDAWNYFDVNRVGRIDAIGVSTFFRFLCKPLGNVDLQ